MQPSEYDFAVRLVGLFSSYGDNAVTLDFCQWAIRYLGLVFKAMGLNCTNEDTARSRVGPKNLDTDMSLAKRSLGWYESLKSPIRGSWF